MTARSIFGFILAGFMLTWLFQNCSAQHFSSQEPLSISHPSVTGSPQESLEGRVLLGDINYLTSTFEGIIHSDQTPAAEYDALRVLIEAEFSPSQHLLGRSCNPYESGNLCGGSAGNTGIEMAAKSSSGREAIRISLCRRVAKNLTLINRIKTKVAGQNTTPEIESAKMMVRLFYPALEDELVQQTAEELLKVDAAMIQANELALDRWRILFLAVCETPGWEIL